MKRGRSTGKPTAEEAAWIVAVKEGDCVACGIVGPCDAHHLLSGGRRRGHLFTVGLCAWCHRGVPDDGYTAKQMRDTYGPSLMDGSKTFHEYYGSDDELYERQRKQLEEQ